jgi:hypothetical protein
MTFYLSDLTKEKFLSNVNRSSINEKILGLIGEYDRLVREMRHFLKLNAMGLYFNLSYLAYIRNLNLLCVTLLNIIILYEVDDLN